MGIVQDPEPVKLICGLIARNENILDQACQVLSKRLGRIDFKSRLMKIDHTVYYQKELGANLKRQFLSFQRLIKPDLLAKIKAFTNQLEKRASLGFQENKRRINIDPGYITKSKLILATTKNYQHRIYLSRGVYAEVTLRFAKGSFRPCQWTYPDYKTEEYIAIFNQIRKHYSNKDYVKNSV